MGEVLKTLRQLQEIELRLASIRHGVEAKARRVAVHKRSLEKAEERLRNNQVVVREKTIMLDAASLDVASKEEAISKHREALNKAKTNKEYAAILSAMNTEKADTAKSENAVLLGMEEIQTLTNDGKAIEEEITKIKKAVEVAESALQEYEAQCAEERGSLEANREAFAEKVAPGTLSVFTRVAAHHDGEAMAAVTKLHPKRSEWACSGCNMNVTLPVVDALRIRDEIQVCQVCGRILYVES